MRSVVFLLVCSAGVLSRAQVATVPREALFQRAFTSTAYVLAMAAQDENLAKSLSGPERRMLDGIRSVSQEARNFQWARENQIPEDGGRAHTVFLGHYFQPGERSFPIDFPVRAGLVFSGEQDRFRLQEGEPARTAMTTASPEGPIYVNTGIINRADVRITLAEALQIMIHEFGHKLGDAKDQVAVDSMAAKIKTWLEARTSSFRLRAGRLEVLKFADWNYEDWHETTLQGRYVGVNVPNRIERFQAISGEGVYALLETDRGITDLTPALMKDLANDASFEPYEGLAYVWKHFRFFRVRAIRVREPVSGGLSFEVEAEQAQTALPFLKKGDPDPAVYRPWERLAAQGEYGQYDTHRIEWTWELSPVRLVNTWPKAMIHESAKAEGKFVSSDLREGDLILTYRIPMKIDIAGSGLVDTRAFLIARIGDSVIEIEGERDRERAELVRFTLKSAGHLLSGRFEPMNVEVEPRVRNLALSYYVRTRLFLDRLDAVELKGEGQGRAPELKWIEVGNGERWRPLKPGEAPVEGGFLRLGFNSPHPLLSLKLQMGFSRRKSVTSMQTEAGQAPRILGRGQVDLPIYNAPVHIPLSQLRQEISGQELVVTLPLLGLDTELKSKTVLDLTPDDLPPWARHAKILEEHEYEVKDQRNLLGLEAVTRSAGALRLNFPTSYRVRAERTTPLSPVRPQGRGARTCRSVFSM